MQHTIMIVEDEKQLQQVISDALSLEHYDVITADDGETALATIMEKKPDVILLDILIPKMDGLEVLATLRKDPVYGARVPVLLLTNYNDPDKISRGVELGAKEYIVKSDIKIEEVVQRIKKLVSLVPA